MVRAAISIGRFRFTVSIKKQSPSLATGAIIPVTVKVSRFQRFHLDTNIPQIYLNFNNKKEW